MRKVLVETTGTFDLFDPISGCVVVWNRPTVADWTGFLETRMGIGQTKLIAGELQETATDEEFASYFAEAKGDADFAVDAFLAAFGLVTPIGEKTEKPVVTEVVKGEKPTADVKDTK